MGGVLVRTEFPEVRQRLEKRSGFPPGTLDHAIWAGEAWELAQVGRISYEEYWRRVGAILGFSTPEEIAEFRREYFSGDRLDEELVSLIRELRPHYKIGLLSNAPDKLDNWLDEEWHIKDLFDAIVYSAQVGMAKPDRSMFQLILEQLDIAPSEALFVDDFPRNIDAARALGMHAIHFTSTKALKGALPQYLVETAEGAGL